MEALADRGERIAAYRALLTAEPAHSLAWFNLAVDELDDGWTIVTADGSRAAHVEHTVAVTADGAWILTARDQPAGAN